MGRCERSRLVIMPVVTSTESEAAAAVRIGAGAGAAGQATAGVKRPVPGCAGRVANGINALHLFLRAGEKPGHAPDRRPGSGSPASTSPTRSDRCAWGCRPRSKQSWPPGHPRSGPPQYVDPVALASLIVAIASLAWTVYHRPEGTHRQAIGGVGIPDRPGHPARPGPGPTRPDQHHRGRGYRDHPRRSVSRSCGGANQPRGAARVRSRWL